jgi:hypothetical protein
MDDMRCFFQSVAVGLPGLVGDAENDRSIEADQRNQQPSKLAANFRDHILCKVMYKFLVSRPRSSHRATARHGGYLQLGEIYDPFHLYEILSTALARRVIAVPGVPAPDALHPATAVRTSTIRPKIRACGVVAVPCTAGIGTSQLHTLSLLFLHVESLFQPKLEQSTTVGERSIRDMSDVFFHEGNRLRIFGVRNQKIELHLLDFFVA